MFQNENSQTETLCRINNAKELRKVHQENDKAVMESYGFNWKKMTESDCVAELMKIYRDLIQKSEMDQKYSSVNNRDLNLVE